MTMSPAEHYEAADCLVAEIAQADASVAAKLPHIQFKALMARLHTGLAACPDHTAWLAESTAVDDDEIRAHHGIGRHVWPHIETKLATDDRL